MKKWYFSKNGEISGPMDLASARSSIEKNAYLYGWHPSFNTWKPLSLIGEFADLIKPSNTVNKVQQDIANEFNDKKSALTKKLNVINENIKETELLKAKLKKKISLYKHLTEDLKEDVQSAIVSVEQQMTDFNKRLLQLQESADNANSEINKVTEQFNQLITNEDNSIEAPIDNVRNISTSSHYVDDGEIEIDIDLDIELVDETVPFVEDAASDKNKRVSLHENKVEQVAEKVEQVADKKEQVSPEVIVDTNDGALSKDTDKTSPEVTKNDKPPAPPAKKRIIIDTKAPGVYREPMKISTQEHTNEPKPEIKTVSTSAQEPVSAPAGNDSVKSNMADKTEESDGTVKKGLTGMFKSVFKGSEPTPNVSTQLKMSEAIKESSEQAKPITNTSSADVVELKNVANDSEELEESEDDKDKPTRRRRRRR
ncbi:MAG: DUF4339 domain-containing protein [Thalassotalea sp.]